MSAPVLITGCSSGIGRAIALATLQAGLPTWATARNPETLTDLAKAGAQSFRSTSPTRHPDEPPSNRSKPSMAPWVH